MSDDKETVIEAEVMTPEELREEAAPERPRIEIIDQGADVLDSAAEVAGYVSKDAEQAIRDKAAQVRRVGDTVSTAVENGTKFVSSVGRLADKLGISDRITFVSRDIGRGSR